MVSIRVGLFKFMASSLICFCLTVEVFVLTSTCLESLWRTSKPVGAPVTGMEQW